MVRVRADASVATMWVMALIVVQRARAIKAMGEILEVRDVARTTIVGTGIFKTKGLADSTYGQILLQTRFVPAAIDKRGRHLIQPFRADIKFFQRLWWDM